MKRRLAFMVAAAMAFSLAACGGGGDASDQVSGSETDGSNAQSSAETGEPQSRSAQRNEFEENQDLRVVAAFNYDNYTYVVTENIGDKPILHYKVAYINFDDNGFATTTDSDGYVGGKDEAANLMPGEKTIAGWYRSSGNYAVAVIYSVDYADGTSWEVSGLDKWVEKTRTSFRVEDYKAGIDAMKDTAALAESNEYAALTSFSTVYGSRFSGKSDLHFSIRNTSDQGISKVNVFVLEFDENGFPVSVHPFDTYCLNGHETGGTVNLAAGQSGDYTDDLFIRETTSQIMMVISAIEFQDGTTWYNPYIYEWILYNNSAC